MSQRNDEDRITRRGLLQVGSATLATAATLKVAAAQDLAKSAIRSSDHHLPNETVPGPRNSALEAENPNSVWSPETDSGTVPPFKYSFALAHKRIESGGGTRQVTIREMPNSNDPHRVWMPLTARGVPEFDWHIAWDSVIM